MSSNSTRCRARVQPSQGGGAASVSADQTEGELWDASV